MLDHKTLYRASWLLIAYTILIIAWGAWVRISGSGAGCGEHWPLCHGAAIPLGASGKTWVEVSHRYSTAIFGILVIMQLMAIRQVTVASNPARFWIWWTLIFTATEALIGRMLVKEGLVDESQSLSRIAVMPLHLVNTSLLLLSEVMTAESIAFGSRARSTISPKTRMMLMGAGVALFVLLSTGAIAALGSHLLPAESLREGLAQDLQVGSHPAVRLRILHPILGLLIPMCMWLFTTYGASRTHDASLAALYRRCGLAILMMVLIGVATLTLLAPTWLKLLHLTMANVLVVLVSQCIFHTVRPRSEC